MAASTKDSDQVFDTHCTPCSRNGFFKEATKFCQDCVSNICVQCVKDHSKFPSLHSHRIVDKAVARNTHWRRQELLTERCSIHHGRIIDRYCEDHDEVCCGACVVFDHRLCENLNEIKESSTSIDVQEHEHVREGLDQVISKIILEQDKRSYYISSIDNEKNTILNDIDNFQDAMIKRIKELTKASREEVLSKHTKLVNAVQPDVKELETILSLVEGKSQKINTRDLNVKTFVNIKKSKKVVKDVSATVDKLSTNWQQSVLDYCFKLEPFRNVIELKSFGHFEDNVNKPFTAKKHEMVNVKMKQEEKCLISGICFLEADMVAITDERNKKLKRLNGNYEVTDSLVLAGSPSSLCKTGPQEVAVALRNEGKVQFVTCDNTLTLGTSFKTEQRCAGLYFDTNHDELFVSCDSWGLVNRSKIRVYKKCGTLCKTIETEEVGNSPSEKSLFSYPKHITVSPVTGMIYIADESKGLIALNRNGKREWTFHDPKLKDLCGVCLLPGNQLLVTGKSSNNLVQVGNDGQEVCELLDATKGLERPYTVVCDKRNARLMVGCSSNEICVYALHRE
ncbi:uncharacterized protein LOC123562902 [Mercenaria mercenaria]|uniref:uncharacterized protein LOC123562902 n=1 Tax=Mercenaria mercenaria TaxID=6596 RepID=UPI00234ED3FD|nr:uncharacterized protein LOC123562902 [Mercenaria mercenaria]